MSFDIYKNVPQELRNFSNWVVWRYEETDGTKPTKIPYSPHGTGKASVTDPKTWGSFEDAVKAVSSIRADGIGFVLSKNDPFCVIDLDDPKNNQAIFDAQNVIFKESKSYAEISPSGKGLHVLMKAEINHGRRRGKIEIYSSERYITVTGQVYREAPIINEQEIASAVFDKLGEGRNVASYYLGVEEPSETDEAIFKRAESAENGDKFRDLYNGNWMPYYSSQSEADFALVDIFAFYSENKAQIKRMFLESALGKRDKAKRNDYVGYMLNRCFDRKLPPVDVDHLRNQIQALISQKREITQTANKQKIEKTTESEPIPDGDIYTVPPGLVGDLAQFIYSQAPRQIPEIALAAALSLMAGVCGRAYNISGMGLNQYVVLLAPTGVGKEGGTMGIDKLLKACVNLPAAQDFVGPSEIASAPALRKYMSNGATKSFVSIIGECGLWLQNLGDDGAQSHVRELRRLILELYNKSGQGQTIRKSIYSDSDKSTDVFTAPAFTIYGESTPEKFYGGLHEGLMAEGFLPRFTIIEYTGYKPRLNKQHDRIIPRPDVIENLQGLMTTALSLNDNNRVLHVGYTDDAAQLMEDFGNQCTDHENSTKKDAVKQVWSRVHVKCMKLAALVAVGCHRLEPTIDRHIFEWAKKIVVHDALNFLHRLDIGEIGSSNPENAQEAVIRNAIKKYVFSNFDDVKTYLMSNNKIPPNAQQMHRDHVIPLVYLSRTCKTAKSFKKDRLGPKAALDRALKHMIETGEISQIPPSEIAKRYDRSKGKVFAVEMANIFV